ncbi:MAG TPA: AAA family ATPase, partial [Planctomycetes bacterium]|nr:AAA family ATPase [Planctomycetota bacterium]
EEERAIVAATTADVQHEIEPVLDREQILELQQVVRRIPIAQAVVDHAVDLVRKTRVKDTADAP